MKTGQLTAKQAAFVREYLVSLNATDAARRAGYSEKTAAEVGYENLRKPQIQDAVERALSERAARTELSADEIITGLRREANYQGEGSSHAARISAWGWLGKHLTMFSDRLDVRVGAIEKLATLTPDQMKALEELGDQELLAAIEEALS